jgi:ClpP class serine protease
MSANSGKFDEDGRHAAYARDGYKCAYCGYHDERQTGDGLTLDHIVARENGGDGQYGKREPKTNVITACLSCNSSKQDKTAREFNAYLKGAGAAPADFGKIRRQAQKKIDIKTGEKNAAAASAWRVQLDSAGGKKLEHYKAEKLRQAKEKIEAAERALKSGGGDSEKKEGPGVQHDPDTGKFMPGSHFRAQLIPGEALAIDPGASGLIAAAIRGQPPSPAAFGFFADFPGPLTFDAEAMTDGIAVLCLKGPIAHHAPSKRADEAYSWHSYEALAREVECAMVGGARAVVLKVDSPGGVAAGMGEAHKALRRLSTKHDVPLYGFSDEMACSAAYHLISACREVWTTPAGHLGSVGVILCTEDITEYKADLHPGQPVTDDVLARAQSKVDILAGQFFRRVARSRGQSPCGAKLSDPRAVAALQAGVYIGKDAVKAGLADGVASWNDFLAYIKSAVSMANRGRVAA